MEIQLEERPLALSVVVGPHTAPDIGLCVRAEPGEPVFNKVPDLIPVRPEDPIEELGVTLAM